MSKFLNDLQVFEARNFKGKFVEESTLFNMLMVEPKSLNYTLKKTMYRNPAMELIDFVNSFPTMTVDGENDMFYYDVQGRVSNALVLIDVETEGGLSLAAGTLTTPLSSNEKFYLYFEQPLASQTQILRNPTGNYQFHVISESKTATGTRYLVEANKEVGQTFNVPLDEIAIKGRWSVVGGTAADHWSDRGMELGHFATNYKMAFRISKMRYQYAISGAMIDQGKNYPIKVPFMLWDQRTGKPVETFAYTNAMEMAAMMEFQLIKSRAVLWSKKNWNVTGQIAFQDNNGYNCPTPYGLFEQIVNYNRLKYNTFDLDYLTDVILSRMIHKRSRGDRKVTLVTGEWGARAFHDAVDKKVGASTILQTDKYITSASASNTGSSNTFGYGYQYTNYRTVNGIEFKIVIADWLDDRDFFSTPHPNGGLGNAESYTYYIMSGEMGSESGIYHLKPKTNTLPAYGYKTGMRDPFTAGGQGKMSPKMMSSSIDGYEVHYMDSVGLAMLDPDAMVELRLTV
jgi:hypothetical protein